MTQKWEWSTSPLNRTEGDVEKLAHEKILSSKLKGLEDAPLTAAEIAKDAVATGLKECKTKTESQMTVRRACRGVMLGMLDISQDLPQTARCLLKTMEASAQEFNLDPKEIVIWSMEGFADVAMLGGPEVRAKILKMIDYEFPGTGENFAAICEKSKQKQWWTR